MVILQVSSSFIIYVGIYLLGGLTLPGIIIFIWLFSPRTQTKNRPMIWSMRNTQKEHECNNNDDKKGWIRLVEDQPCSENGKYLNPARFSPSWKNPASLSFSYFAILRHGTLFCYDNEKTNHSTCQLILPIHDYLVSLYPHNGSRSDINNKPSESELYNRTMAICLTPKNTHTPTYYLTCQHASDKEDWYFALLVAARFLSEDIDDPWQHPDWCNSTMYDSSAMTLLEKQIMTTHNNTQPSPPPPPPHAWWHALLGRLFLGIYKTDTWRRLWHTKLKTKLDKLNAQMDQEQQWEDGGFGTAGTSPLELQHIHMGDTIPSLTSMVLDTFDSDGHVVISGQFDYDGELEAMLRIDLSNLLQWAPFPKGGLELTIKLRHCSGKMIFKVKPPPSNRIWVGFASMPTMDWQVTVWDKQIKWSLVNHLIQAKINDVVMDTLVVPNMEDVPFFDSNGQGGIFGERPSTTMDNNDRVPVDPIGEKQQQQQPTVSKLVQGYINRIKAPHKMISFSALNPGSSPKAT